MNDVDLHKVWLMYRGAIIRHIQHEAKLPPRFDTEAKYRERAEKAGLAAIISLLELS